ncbi:MAG: S-layer homology domain-containing protein [Clostridia bacterium]|nr:S-layer homology domain-containing protein [Clostridia bacterium]
MKRNVSLLLAVILTLLSFSSVSAKADGSLSNFQAVQSYTEGQFTDVSSSAWYAPNVKYTYEIGLMNGNSDTTFNPDGNILLSETIALASRLHSIYYNGEASFEASTPWYQSYVDYAIDNRIIGSGKYTYFDKATRADFAEIMAKALPSEVYNKINTVDDDAIPDVKTAAKYSDAVYTLYRAGIVTGSDAEGTFNPTSNIKRSEVAAIVSRIVDKTQRKYITLKYEVSETYKYFPVKTLTAVTGAECKDSYTGYSIQINNGYIEDNNTFNYDVKSVSDYDRYFVPYIEYLESNPNVTRYSSDGMDLGGFTNVSYTYKLNDGSNKYIDVSWNYGEYTKTYSIRVWMYGIKNGKVVWIQNM